MEVNPYQAPQPVPRALGVKSGRREDVYSVAIYQKVILICILIYLIALIGQFVLPEGLFLMLAIAAGVGVIVGTLFVFLLAAKVYHPAIGILLGLLTLVPVVGLIVLLRINAKAIKILKDNGVHVGLIGARMSDLQT